MEALAQAGVSKLAAQCLGRERDSASGVSDGQRLAIGIVPLSRGDQQVPAKPSSSMINQRVGRRTHAEIDRRS